MDEADADMGVFRGYMTGKAFRTVDRAVLAARAAEGNHQAGEFPGYECLYMRIDHGIDIIKESKHTAVFLEETDHRLVPACHGLILYVAAGVVDGPAVKHISATVA